MVYRQKVVRLTVPEALFAAFADGGREITTARKGRFDEIFFVDLPDEGGEARDPASLTDRTRAQAGVGRNLRRCPPTGIPCGILSGRYRRLGGVRRTGRPSAGDARRARALRAKTHKTKRPDGRGVAPSSTHPRPQRR